MSVKLKFNHILRINFAINLRLSLDFFEKLFGILPHKILTKSLCARGIAPLVTRRNQGASAGREVHLRFSKTTARNISATPVMLKSVICSWKRKIPISVATIGSTNAITDAFPPSTCLRPFVYRK